MKTYKSQLTQIQEVLQVSLIEDLKFQIPTSQVELAVNRISELDELIDEGKAVDGKAPRGSVYQKNLLLKMVFEDSKTSELVAVRHAVKTELGYECRKRLAKEAKEAEKLAQAAIKAAEKTKKDAEKLAKKEAKIAEREAKQAAKLSVEKQMHRKVIELTLESYDEMEKLRNIGMSRAVNGVMRRPDIVKFEPLDMGLAWAVMMSVLSGDALGVNVAHPESYDPFIQDYRSGKHPVPDLKHRIKMIQANLDGIKRMLELEVEREVEMLAIEEAGKNLMNIAPREMVANVTKSAKAQQKQKELQKRQAEMNAW